MSGNKSGGTGSAVKVLGTGCAKCDKLEANVKTALAQMGKDITVDHIRDINEIADYGVMLTPALVINGKVKSAGKVLSVNDAVELLKKHM